MTDDTGRRTCPGCDEPVLGVVIHADGATAYPCGCNVDPEAVGEE